MKTSLLIAMFTCLTFGEICRADSLNALTEQEIRRELCRLEIATKQVARSNQKAFMKACASELKTAEWLGEFYFDPNFYPEGFGQWVARPGNASKRQDRTMAPIGPPIVIGGGYAVYKIIGG